MRRALSSPVTVTVAIVALLLVSASIVYAVVSQVVRDVPATATIVAGVELDVDNIAVTYDAAGEVPVDVSRPLDFGTIPDFQDLRLWSPFLSPCIYVHNLSSRSDLGPATTLTVRVLSDSLGKIGGGVSLVSSETCEQAAHDAGTPLGESERTISPGKWFHARVLLHLDRAPDRGPFNFSVTFAGVGTALAEVAVDVVEADNTVLKASMRFPEPVMWEVQAPGGPYTQVGMPGIDVTGGGPDSSGQPDVCVDRRLAAVPHGSNGSRARVNIVGATPRVRQIIQDVNLYPVQPSPRDEEDVPGEGLDGEAALERFGDKPFARDAGAYGTDAFFPPDVVQVRHLGRMRDLDLIQVSVACSQYNPVTRELRLYASVDYELRFEDTAGYFLPERATSAFEPAAGTLYSAVLNRGAVMNHLDTARLPDYTCVGHEYLVITDPQFRGPADDLADWKNTKGISTTVVETGTGPGDAGTTRDEIQQYIRDQYNSCLVRPSYVLLLGDNVHIPVFNPTFAGVIAATDLDYALMDDDIMPDLAVGRMPVRSLVQAQTIVDKTIRYERTPPGDADFYESMSFASYFQCCAGFTSAGTDMRGYIETSEFIRNQMRRREDLHSRYSSIQAIPAIPPPPGTVTAQCCRLTWVRAAVSMERRDTGHNDAFNQGRFLIRAFRF